MSPWSTGIVNAMDVKAVRARLPFSSSYAAVGVFWKLVKNVVLVAREKSLVVDI